MAILFTFTDLNVLPDVSPGGLNEKRYSYHEFFLKIEPTAPLKFGLMPGWANITGIALIIIFVIMIIFSLPAVRRGGHFEVW